MKYLSNKKGQWIEILVIIVVVFLSVTVFGALSLTNKEVKNFAKEYANESQLNTTISDKIIDRTYEHWDFVWDGIAIFVFLAICMGAILSVFWIDTHPAWLIVNIILLIPVLAAGTLLSTLYHETMLTTFSWVQTTMPMSFFLISHMLEISCVMMVIIGICSYAKWRIG